MILKNRSLLSCKAWNMLVCFSDSQIADVLFFRAQLSTIRNVYIGSVLDYCVNSFWRAINRDWIFLIHARSWDLEWDYTWLFLFQRCLLERHVGFWNTVGLMFSKFLGWCELLYCKSWNLWLWVCFCNTEASLFCSKSPNCLWVLQWHSNSWYHTHLKLNL